MDRGRFITLEGGEGTGKSTQIRMLAEALHANGITNPLMTREPGGAPGAEEIRKLLVEGDVNKWEPETEALLNYAARFEHVAKTIRPAMDEGRWVLCDRFADSTLAYQGYGHGLEPEMIRRLHRLVIGGFHPDLTLVLDLPIEEGLARAGARLQGGDGGAASSEDRYERMDVDFHIRLREGFLTIAKNEPDRCVVVDASGDVETVGARIRDAVSERLQVTFS